MSGIMKRSVSFVLCLGALICLFFVFVSPVKAYSGTPDTSVQHHYMVSGTSKCINVYTSSSTPAAGNYITSYNWSGNTQNQTQNFHLSGRPQSLGGGWAIVPIRNTHLAVYCDRGSLNPKAYLTSLNNYPNETDVTFFASANGSSAAYYVKPRTSNHTSDMYLYADPSLPATGGSYVNFCKGAGYRTYWNDIWY